MSEDPQSQKSVDSDKQKPSARRKDFDMIQDRLVKGEKLLAMSYVHLGIYWKPVVVIIMGLLVGLLLVWPLGIILIFAGVVLLIYNALKARILLFAVTNKRMLARYGLLMVDVVDIHFEKVESIELERMLPGYLMGYSNLIVHGTGNRLIVIPYVGNAAKLRRAYNESVLADKD